LLLLPKALSFSLPILGLRVVPLAQTKDEQSSWPHQSGSSLDHISTLISPSWVMMDFVMALKTNSQEELYLIEPIPEPSSSMVNLTRHLATAHLADWIVG
jgi:hypothetical protein